MGKPKSKYLRQREKRMAKLEKNARDEMITAAVRSGALRNFTRQQIEIHFILAKRQLHRVIAEIDPETPRLSPIARREFSGYGATISRWWAGLDRFVQEAIEIAASEAKRPLGKHI